jgi:hypothetical protein
MSSMSERVVTSIRARPDPEGHGRCAPEARGVTMVYRALALALMGLTTFTGCLTPSMGRKADDFMGGSPSKNPISVRDVETSRLVGQNFDGTPVDRPIVVEETLVPRTPEQKEARP